MSWEKEIDEVDKALGEHRIGLVNRAVMTTDGQPQRHWIHIKLGAGPQGERCSHCGQAVERGMALSAEGALTSVDGEIKPREIVAQTIRELNEFHARMERYGRRHGVPVYAGQKRT